MLEFINKRYAAATHIGLYVTYKDKAHNTTNLKAQLRNSAVSCHVQKRSQMLPCLKAKSNLSSAYMRKWEILASYRALPSWITQMNIIKCDLECGKRLYWRAILCLTVLFLDVSDIQLLMDKCDDKRNHIFQENNRLNKNANKRWKNSEWNKRGRGIRLWATAAAT